MYEKAQSQAGARKKGANEVLFSSSGVGSQMGEPCGQGKRGKEAGALGPSSALTVCRTLGKSLTPWTSVCHVYSGDNNLSA